MVGFVGFQVSPANECLASLAKNIANGMEAGDQTSLLGGAHGDVYTRVKEVGSSMTTMETLGDYVVMRCKVGSAVTTRVDTGAIEVDHGVVQSLRVFRFRSTLGVVMD